MCLGPDAYGQATAIRIRSFVDMDVNHRGRVEAAFAADSDGSGGGSDADDGGAEEQADVTPSAVSGIVRPVDCQRPGDSLRPRRRDATRDSASSEPSPRWPRRPPPRNRFGG